jgi:hypothetical protein
MRHPQNTDRARHVVDQIIDRLRADGFIATAELADLGNHPENDV